MSPFYIDSTSEQQSVGALALGSFDGVHLGHQELLKRALELSRLGGLRSAALSFSPNPKSFFSTPTKPFFQIYDPHQNFTEMLSCGIDSVFIKNFDDECSRMSADEFLNFVFARLKFTHLVVGFDFRLGKDRRGGQRNLHDWCDQNKVELCVVRAQEKFGEKISSTKIKKLLLAGEVGKASDLIGRPHFYQGEVRSDQGLGTKIGFPTLNIELGLNTAIAHGVYTSVLSLNEKMYFGLSNIGMRPTVFESAPHLVLETHILDPQNVEVGPGDLVKVEIKRFMRPEKKFVSIAELKSQIEADVATARGLVDLYKN